MTYRIYGQGYYIEFLPCAVSWEQEPESLSAWLRQRTRWARGNNYIISKYLKKIFQPGNRRMLGELFQLVFLYCFYTSAMLNSDILFIASLAGWIKVPLVGPFLIIWVLAFLMYVVEILIAFAYEGEEQRVTPGTVLLAYFFYSKLWMLVVLRGFYYDFIRHSARIWAKTEHFAVLSVKQNADRPPRGRKKS
jgi:cellulose synthase/poly-beta-1,6-N-acetylglucosamine synthase-like glycosyltransferase